MIGYGKHHTCKGVATGGQLTPQPLGPFLASAACQIDGLPTESSLEPQIWGALSQAWDGPSQVWDGSRQACSGPSQAWGGVFQAWDMPFQALE